MSDDAQRPEPTQDGPTSPDDELLDPGTVEELRALLRDDPLDIDAQRRERSIRAALDAAGSDAAVPDHAATDQAAPGATAPGVPAGATRRGDELAAARARRRGRSAPALVAAATLAVIAAGALALGLGTGDSDESTASGAAADSAGELLEQETPAADGAGGDAEVPARADEGSEEAGAGSTGDAESAPNATTRGASDAPVHLGEHPDTAGLLDAADSAAATGFDAQLQDGSAEVPSATRSACVDVPGPGSRVVATGSVSGRDVLVVTTPGDAALVVLDAQDCEELDRR